MAGILNTEIGTQPQNTVNSKCWTSLSISYFVSEVVPCVVEPNISIRNQGNRFEERKGDVVEPDISRRDIDSRRKRLAKEADSDYIRMRKERGLR